MKNTNISQKSKTVVICKSHRIEEVKSGLDYHLQEENLLCQLCLRNLKGAKCGHPLRPRYAEHRLIDLLVCYLFIQPLIQHAFMELLLGVTLY